MRVSVPTCSAPSIICSTCQPQAIAAILEIGVLTATPSQHKGIRPIATDQGVGARAAIEDIRVIAPKQQVIARPTKQRIHAVAAITF